MIWYDRTYKWNRFSDLIGSTSNLVLQDVERNVPLRTDIFNRANYHGTYSSNTLAWWRVFNFTGVIHGTRAERDIARTNLVNLIQPEPNPSDSAFYDLTWKSDSDWDRQVKAKVFQVPFPTNWLCDPFIDFTFQLYSEWPEIYDPTAVETTGFTWLITGFLIPFTLPYTAWWLVNPITITNTGNWTSGVILEVTGTITNPHIVNVTNGRHLSFTWSFDWFKVDTFTRDSITWRNYSVTSNWVDIRSKRDHWVPILLDKWENTLVVVNDSIDVLPVKISHYNTFLY